MALFTRSLWPGSGKVPYFRLILALILAPAILSVLLAAASYGIYGMTASSHEVVLRGTYEAAIALTLLLFIFTPTFGLIGVAALWSSARRGIMSWASLGAILGANAGALFSFILMPRVDFEVIGLGAAISMILFLLIRWIAGVQSDRKVAA